MRGRARTVLSAWPRIAEIALAVWLAVSVNTVFESAPRSLVVHDTIVAALIALVSAVALSGGRVRYVHLANLLTAMWLVAFAMLIGQHHSSSQAQNEIMVGLSLLMLAVVPSRTLDPPLPWSAYYTSHRADQPTSRQAPR